MLVASVVVAPSQDPDQKADQFFSGNVLEFGADRVVVERQVLGKSNEKRTFVITASTRIEGELQRNARVTVRFVSAEEGDVAVSIIVRKRG
jgi:hypothetical protein